MRNVRKLTALALATVGVLALTSTPAWAKEGLGVVGTFGGTGAGKLSLVPFGESGTGRAGDPGSGVAVNSAGDVYVADTGNNRVEWFNSAGAKVEGEFNGSGTLANEGGKKAPAPLSKPEAIAVDNDSGPSYGDVYVVDESRGVVDKFSATGEFIFQIKTESVSAVAIDPSGDVWLREPNGDVQEYSDAVDNVLLTSLETAANNGSAITVDSEDNLYLTEKTSEVGKFTKTGTSTGGVGDVCNGGNGTCLVSGLAIDPATNDLFVDRHTFISQYGPFGEPFQAPVYESKPNTLTDGAGLAVGPTNHEIYVADAATDEIVVFADGSVPAAPEALAPKEVKSKSAIFRGKLEPAATKLKYYFEYNTGSSCTSGSTTPVKEGEGEVQEEVRELEPGQEYTYCIVAENTFGTESSSPVTPFSTLAAAPEVISESASNVEKERGQFRAVINPEHSKQATTYYFEYSTTGSVESDTLSGSIKIAPEYEESPIPAEVFEPREVLSEEKGLPEVTSTYYYRVVATNETGTTEGKVQAYTKLPIVAGESFSDLTSIGAKLEATVYPNFQETTYRFEYATNEAALKKGEGAKVAGADAPSKEAFEKNEGITRFPSEYGTLPANEGAVPPTFVSAEVSLTPGQTYYYRVVAENATSKNPDNINEGEPVHGLIEHLTASPGPAATTGEAQNITGTSATLSGEVNPKGTETSYSFQYISETGYQAALAKGAADPYAEGGATAPVSAGSGETTEAVGPVPADDLLPGTTYYYRLVATNKSGVQGFGGEATFKTGSALPPAVSTGGASGVSQNSATLSGTVTTNGLQTNYGFEIGTSPNTYGPATGLGAIGGAATKEVHVTLGELQPGTTYYYRVEATNADGTVPGQPASFTTPGFPTLIAPPASPPLIAYTAPAFPKEEKSSGTTVKTLTNKEKLAKALKTCKKEKSKTKREKCEKAAKKKYPVAKAKKKGKAGKK